MSFLQPSWQIYTIFAIITNIHTFLASLPFLDHEASSSYATCHFLLYIMANFFLCNMPRLFYGIMENLLYGSWKIYFMEHGKKNWTMVKKIFWTTANFFFFLGWWQLYLLDHGKFLCLQWQNYFMENNNFIFWSMTNLLHVPCQFYWRIIGILFFVFFFPFSFFSFSSQLPTAQPTTSTKTWRSKYTY